MFNLGASMGIPCYFIPKSEGLNFGQNNMGSQWQHLNIRYSGEKIHFTRRSIKI